ncbi:uncharacterized protein DEA37_0009282 [Paragonimus westermani]|uniref:RHD domain-containing protein n=1 Tax=Paragonimus westermani TaxID=34504 RepID=A0A5J4NXM3_9TREM|nr:uncharacterized protein DEA37_0009282 [Paragonimus westermani]
MSHEIVTHPSCSSYSDVDTHVKSPADHLEAFQLTSSLSPSSQLTPLQMKELIADLQSMPPDGSSDTGLSDYSTNNISVPSASTANTREACGAPGLLNIQGNMSFMPDVEGSSNDNYNPTTSGDAVFVTRLADVTMPTTNNTLATAFVEITASDTQDRTIYSSGGRLPGFTAASFDATECVELGELALNTSSKRPKMTRDYTASHCGDEQSSERFTWESVTGSTPVVLPTLRSLLQSNCSNELKESSSFDTHLHTRDSYSVEGSSNPSCTPGGSNVTDNEDTQTSVIRRYGNLHLSETMGAESGPLLSSFTQKDSFPTDVSVKSFSEASFLPDGARDNCPEQPNFHLGCNSSTNFDTAATERQSPGVTESDFLSDLPLVDERFSLTRNLVSPSLMPTSAPLMDVTSPNDLRMLSAPLPAPLSQSEPICQSESPMQTVIGNGEGIKFQPLTTVGSTTIMGCKSNNTLAVSPTTYLAYGSNADLPLEVLPESATARGRYMRRSMTANPVQKLHNNQLIITKRVRPPPVYRPSTCDCRVRETGDCCNTYNWPGSCGRKSIASHIRGRGSDISVRPGLATGLIQHGRGNLNHSWQSGCSGFCVAVPTTRRTNVSSHIRDRISGVSARGYWNAGGPPFVRHFTQTPVRANGVGLRPGTLSFNQGRKRSAVRSAGLMTQFVQPANTTFQRPRKDIPRCSVMRTDAVKQTDFDEQQFMTEDVVVDERVQKTSHKLQMDNETRDIGLDAANACRVHGSALPGSHVHRTLGTSASFSCLDGGTDQCSCASSTLIHTSTTDSYITTSRKLALHSGLTHDTANLTNNGKSHAPAARVISYTTTPSLHQTFPEFSLRHGCRIRILEQPESQHRARYQTEGSRGAVKDRSGCGFPTIQCADLSIRKYVVQTVEPSGEYRLGKPQHVCTRRSGPPLCMLTCISFEAKEPPGLARRLQDDAVTDNVYPNRVGLVDTTCQLIGWDGRASLQVFVATEVGRPRPHPFYQAYLVAGKLTKYCVQTIREGVNVIEMPFASSNNWKLRCVHVCVIPFSFL